MKRHPVLLFQNYRNQQNANKVPQAVTNSDKYETMLFNFHIPFIQRGGNSPHERVFVKYYFMNIAEKEWESAYQWGQKGILSCTYS